MSYDFLTWTSFPSSRKIENEKAVRKYYWVMDKIPVTPGAVVKWTIKGKQENISLSQSAADLHWINAEGKSAYAAGALFPVGTFEWRPCTGGGPWKAPAEARFVRVMLCGAGGTPKGITWFDDLKIYQDDKLIYDNYFTALRPGKVVPNVVTPPEIIVGMVQRFKAGRAGEDALHRPLAVASI